ncbi:MAG: hypothetical protein QXK11_05770 [Pyrobaculum sp.]
MDALKRLRRQLELIRAYAAELGEERGYPGVERLEQLIIQALLDLGAMAPPALEAPPSPELRPNRLRAVQTRRVVKGGRRSCEGDGGTEEHPRTRIRGGGAREGGGVLQAGWARRLENSRGDHKRAGGTGHGQAWW